MLLSGSVRCALLNNERSTTSLSPRPTCQVGLYSQALPHGLKGLMDWFTLLTKALGTRCDCCQQHLAPIDSARKSSKNLAWVDDRSDDQMGLALLNPSIDWSIDGPPYQSLLVDESAIFAVRIQTAAWIYVFDLVPEQFLDFYSLKLYRTVEGTNGTISKNAYLHLNDHLDLGTTPSCRHISGNWNSRTTSTD